MIKIKNVMFNVEDEGQKKLLDAINNSEENFAKKTKELWAKELNIKYTHRSAGRPSEK